METNDLFNRIKARDQDAFKQLTEDYGWKLYARIRKTTDNRDKADLIFKRTFSRFYNSMEEYDSDDPIEAMLCLYADVITKELAPKPVNFPSRVSGADSASAAELTEFTEEPAPSPQKAHSPFATFFYVLGVILLVLGIAAALWIMAGLLMDLNILPEFDLGYEWFNANIAPWF